MNQRIVVQGLEYEIDMDPKMSFLGIAAKIGLKFRFPSEWEVRDDKGTILWWDRTPDDYGYGRGMASGSIFISATVGYGG